MKKLIILALLATATINAQRDYARSSIGVETGANKLENIEWVGYGDVHFNYTFFLNEKFGGKADVGASRIKDLSMFEASLQVVGNLGRVFDFESFAPRLTLLASGGGAITYAGEDTRKQIMFRKNHFNPVMGFKFVYEVTESMYVTLGSNLMMGINSHKLGSEIIETTNKWEWNIGLTAPILRDRHNKHAIFYLEEEEEEPKPEIHNFYNETIKHVKEPSTYYVQFAYDAHTFIEGSQAYGIIKTAVEQLEPGQKLYLTAYASPENGTGNPNYNYELAKRRGETVKAIAISHGANPEQIEVNPVGSLPTWDGNNIELSRSVRIEVKN